MNQSRKRVVTGLDSQGRSIITSSGPVPSVIDSGAHELEEQWIIDATPPILDEAQNAADEPEHPVWPAPGGAIFRIVAFKKGDGPMHVTDTIDFVVILSGEVYLVMEEGEVLLTPGDTVIQRATKHAWENRSDEECVLAGVLIGMPPAGS
jgi:quercetin dioxygenase-like cupin family protein